MEAVGGAGTLRRAVLDIDREGIVRSLTLTRDWRWARRRWRSTCAGPALKEAAFYTLKGALAADGEVFDGDRPAKRLALLARHRLGRK